ncbi:MAG: efflux RND transporter periplasmic adaptor subunit [Nannocystales bacterium]
MKKWIGRGVLVLVLLAVAVGVFLSMQPKPLAVDVVEVSRGTVQVSIKSEGTTRVKDRYVVRSTVNGNLARIELEPGDAVDPETVLARIEPIAPPLLDASQIRELETRSRASGAAVRQAGASVARAVAAKKYAEQEFDRTKQLLAKGGISQREFDAAKLEAATAKEDLHSAKFGASVAKYELQTAKAAVNRARKRDGGEGEEPIEIHSPVAGEVLRILRKSEGVIHPAEELLEVADLSALEVVVDVLTSEAVEISLGDTTNLVNWGGDTSLVGHVRLIEPAAFMKVSALGVEEQRVNVVIALEDAGEASAKLGDGYRVEADILVWRAEDVVKVPVSALFRDEDGSWAVFVVEGDVARVRHVELGRRNDLETVVASGLAAEDRVIVHPSDSLEDGALVQAR